MSSSTLVSETVCTDIDNCSTGWQKQNIDFQLANYGTSQRMDRSRQVFSTQCSQNVFRTVEVSILKVRKE